MRAYRVWGVCLIFLALIIMLIGIMAAGLRTGAEALSDAIDTEPPAYNLFAPPSVETPAPTPSGFTIEVLKSVEAKPLGSILIYHTHTYEAYEQTERRYRETEKWRTADEAHNVVRVGEELSTLLTALGFEVTHDRGAYEPPELSSSYTRSLAMLNERAARGESYDLYIDLHRDAYTASSGGMNTVSIGGSDAALIMLLIGKGEGQTSHGFDEKPDWESNLSFARLITELVNEQAAGLCKEVRVKSGRFNQHVAPRCVLIEVGNNKNTLAQALSSLPYLADAIKDALQTPLPSPNAD